MKKIVFYSSNSKKRDRSSNCTVFPSWGAQWDAMAMRHPDCEITLVVQLNGRYFLDIQDGELVRKPEHVDLKILPMEADLHDFIQAVAEISPDVAVAMPGPVSGYDWNGIRDAAIAKGLRARGIDTFCYSPDTALDCFDKARTHQFLSDHGFRAPKAVYLHHELFTSDKMSEVSTGNVYQEYILWELENFGMPVVIKSTTGSSSMGIYIAKTYEDAKNYLLSQALTEDVVLEQFLQGKEYGAEIHGDRGRYHVSPPYRIFNTAPVQLNDPLGQTTVKYGPILDPDLHIDRVRNELLRLAELMQLSGIIEVDLILAGGEWYILEINNRWSGLTTLITASQGRLPYDVYMDEAVGTDVDYGLPENLNYACQFKLPQADTQVLEAIAGEEEMKSIIQYEVRMKGRDPFVFSDAVIAGYATMGDLLQGFAALQAKYPDQIREELVQALIREEAV